MRNFKKIIGAGILGFLAFAPPGTMIAIFLFLVWLFGNAWLVAGSFIIVAIIGIIWLIRRKKQIAAPNIENNQQPK